MLFRALLAEAMLPVFEHIVLKKPILLAKSYLQVGLHHELPYVPLLQWHRDVLHVKPHRPILVRMPPIA